MSLCPFTDIATLRRSAAVMASFKLCLVLVWCLAAGTSLAQFDPLRDFCRRWGHQSAVVDRKLYVDGGLVNYKPFAADSQNMSSEPLLTPLALTVSSHED